MALAEELPVYKKQTRCGFVEYCKNTGLNGLTEQGAPMELK